MARWGLYVLAIVAVIASLLASQLSLPGKLSHDIVPVQIRLRDDEAALQRFAKTLSFRTISAFKSEDNRRHSDAMRKMHQHLRNSWPEVFRKLEVTKGSSENKLPALFISHQDVVDSGPEDRWTHPPFAGIIADGYVWGRGALDVKVTMTAMLEAIDHLLSKGYRPQRTIYVAFGEDEEVGGELGAGKIAAGLRQQGVKLEFIMDEGGTVLMDGLRGITEIPVALVGTAEKTQINVAVTINGTGGHPMTPPSWKQAAVSRMARFITKLEAGQPGPRLVPPVPQMLYMLAPAASSKLLGFLLHHAHSWLVGRLLAQVMYNIGGEMRALILTSHVVNDITTTPSGRNVVPSQATANINMRILPGTNEESLVHKIKKALDATCDKGGVLTSTSGILPTAQGVASLENPGFQFLRQAAHETLEHHQDLVVVPYLMIARTDSSHYMDLCDGNVYRFIPFHMNKTAGDIQRVHGIDERVEVRDYLQGVKFYIRMLELSSS